MVIRVDGLMAKERENLKLKMIKKISAGLSRAAGRLSEAKEALRIEH
jgi:hypothetical protein